MASLGTGPSYSSPLSVAIIGHTAALGGAELVLLRLLDNLDRERFEPVVLLFGDGPLVQRLQAAGHRVEVLGLAGEVATARRDELASGLLATARNAVTTVRFCWQLRRRLRAIAPNLVHTNTLKSHLLAGLAARSLRLPLVFWVHDRISADYLPARVATLTRALIRYLPDHTLVNSLATLQTLRPMAADRWTLAYPGVEASESEPAGDPAANAVPPVRIGLLGRISPTKGQQIFLRAAAELARTRPDVRFVIAGSALFGEDDYERSTIALAQTLGLGDAVEFTGFVSDVGALLASLSVLVHASPVPEPFGQVLVEAMLAGVPVIGTRAGGVPEILNDDGETLGVLVEPGDVPGLAAAMLQVLDEPVDAAQRAVRARQSAARRFGVAPMVDAVTTGWHRALDRHQPKVD